MLGLGRKRKVRRQRARQLRAESTESAWTVFRRHVGMWPAVVCVGFFVLVMLVGSLGERALPYALNQKIDGPILARMDFTVPDPEQGAANIRAARQAVANYYRVNTDLIDRIAGELTGLFEAAQAESFEKFQEQGASFVWSAEPELFERLRAASEEQRAGFTRSLEKLREDLRQENTAGVPTGLVERTPVSTASEVLVIRPRPATEGNAEPGPPTAPVESVPTLQLIQIANRDAVEGRALKLAESFAPYLRRAVHEVLLDALKQQPILVYDQKRTQEEMAAAERNAPPGEKHFERGKPFVFPHTFEEGGASGDVQSGLTRTDLDLLEREEGEYRSFLKSDHAEAVKLRSQRLYEHTGAGLILFILTIGLFLYVGLYEPRVLAMRTRSIAFAGLLLLCIAAVRFIDVRFAHAQFVLTPVLLAASILTIAYPRRFAAGVTTIFIVMVTLVIRADVGEMVTLFAAGFVTTLLLHDIRTRTKILSVGILAGALVFTTSLAFGLTSRQELGFIVSGAAIAAGNTILAALIIQGVLPFIERVFKVATALTLLEYRDANRPLLQRLAREAPGTYNHSLVLGTMCEAACESIGANGLLVHVGALYHDVGKIPKSEYFVENQEAAINRHDNLSPTMSLLIILGHVKDGLELAREYGLPRVLHPFIAEHHGTTVVRFFHHAASEKQPHISSGKHDREVAEAEFRYPGPKPSSKESAILMLCDGVEGAVRALHEPTAGRIESSVHQVLQTRLKDGQFDDCDITLRELHRVEESLVKSLCRFYHGRVAYPKEAAPKAEAHAEEAQAQGESTQLAG